MLKISLVNMPFAALNLPSIALTQLRSVVEEQYGERVRVRILYLNQEYARYLGENIYGMLNSNQATNSGLGEWFFRQIAFPEEKDNAQDYFRRYYPHLTEDLAATRGMILAKRIGLERFMRQQAAKYRLQEEDVVGFTTMFSQNIPSFAMARLIKEANQRLLVVMGGANCEAPMGLELAKRVPALDYVFSGPGLVSFPKFVGHALDGELEKAGRTRGVYCQGNAQSPTQAGPGAMGEELPIEVPVGLDYDSFMEDLERNFPGSDMNPSLCFETSRGCWWGERAHCTFCGLNGSTMGYRAMKPEACLELLRDLLSRYSDRCRRFESVDNIMPKEYLEQVFPFLEVPQGVSFFYEVKADLNAKDMETLSRARVNELQPGIESLNTSTLKLMKKGTTGIRNVGFLKNCVKYGLKPAWNLLIGFPGEGQEVYRKYLADMPLLPHLPPPTGAYPVRFDRFSPYHVKADEYGLKLSPYDFYRFLYPFDDETLANLAYYFEDRNYNAQYMVEMIAWQKKLNDGVGQWKERWHASDGRLKATLYLKEKGDSLVVHDTRSGSLIERELSKLALEALLQMDERGYKLPDLSRHLEVDGAEVAKVIAQLEEWQLLFEENGRYIGLVLDLRDQISDLDAALAERSKRGAFGEIAQT